MNTVVHKKLPGYKPLLYWEGQLLLAAGFDLALADLELNQLTFLARLPASRLKRFFTRLRPVTRLLRLETGPAIDPGDGLNCLLCHQGSIYKINLQDGSFVKEFELPHGGRPLTLTKVDVPGFLPGIYLGEYFGNPEMGEARIFHRTEHGE